MSMSLHQKLRTGRVILGLNLQYPAAGIIECIGAGWDWVWIDGQHGQHDYRSVLECVRVADSCGIAPVVRVSGHEPGLIGPAMDMRPAGIMVPMVNTVGEAQAIVKAARFPPLGERSYGGRRVIDLGTREYFKTADQDTILIVQLETKEALDNAAAIAATEGVDVLFFSPDDIKLRLGIAIDTPITDSKELTAGMQQVITAAQNAGKVGGCVTPTPASIKMASSLGYSLLVGGGDVAMLRETASATLADLRESLDPKHS